MQQVWLSRLVALSARGAATACLCLCTTAASAWAALPPIFDRIPEDVWAAAATPSLAQLDKHARDLLGAIEAPGLSTPAQLLAVLGLGEGLDTNRPIAAAITPPADEDADPGLLVYLPTTDPDALLAAYTPQDAGDGLKQLHFNGQSFYVRLLDNQYVLLATDRARAAAAEQGHQAFHEGAVGAVGQEAASRSDVFVVVEPAGLARVAAEAAKFFEGQAAMVGMMGAGDPQQLQQQAAAVGKTVQSLAAQSAAAVVGFTAESLGATLDIALAFKPGTDAFTTLQARGDAHTLLTRLPDQPFLFAGAGDFSSDTVRDLFQRLSAVAGQGNEAGPFAEGLATGLAFAVYTTQGGLLTGLFANSLQYIASKEPAAAIESLRKSIEALGQANPPLFTGTFEENAAEVAGVKAHRWSMTMQPGAAGFGQQQQALGALFGSMGLSGYVAALQDGALQSIGPDTATLEKAIRLAKGDGASLADNALVTGVSQKLPAPRTGEGFVNVGELLKQALFVAATFLGQVNVQIPPDLPPVGVALQTDQGTARVTTFAPAPVIHTVTQLLQTLQAMQGGGAGGGPPF
ncbi:MAG: hypothetical protein D6824_07325 [Planctomycetota bacterium]|nr:MAG: hypothetical protein D6824_07325 [Planctomycetota bacterium]